MPYLAVARRPDFSAKLFFQGRPASKPFDMGRPGVLHPLPGVAGTPRPMLDASTRDCCAIQSNRACAYHKRIIKIGIGPYSRGRPWFLQWYHVKKSQEVNRMQNIQHMAQPHDEVEEHSEGKIAKKIEQQTAKLPSDLFMWAALASIGASFVLEVTGHEEKSRFVGQWVAPFLLFGLYNKIVKVAGSDRTH
jgi:hypothetical protein